MHPPTISFSLGAAAAARFFITNFSFLVMCFYTRAVSVSFVYGVPRLSYHTEEGLSSETLVLTNFFTMMLTLL